MTATGLYSTWVEIDLEAVKTNIRYIRQRTSAQVMAVVKANGYGHGATRVAQAALQGGASWCGVARIDEALELRQNGLACPILIFGYTPPERVLDAIQHKIALTVWAPEQAALAARLANERGLTAHLHLKVDTGMSRLGIRPEQALDVLKQIKSMPGALAEGLFTHFARADEADQSTTLVQIEQFTQIVEECNLAGLRPSLVHACNSAATLTQPAAHFDMVRIGIAMYGLHPSNECILPAEMRPVMQWKAVLSQVKDLPAGRGVSYGHIYTTKTLERIGTLPVGYADGYRRMIGNVLLVAGQRVPVIGRVCMDQIMLQLNGAPRAAAGDEVVLLGGQGKDRITAEEIAQRWGTINYEVTCGVAARVTRVFLDN
jgi:alanine racemase